MNYLRFALIAGTVGYVLCPTPVRAAFDTEVLTAFETQRGLPDLHLGVTFDRRMKRAQIKREWIEEAGGVRNATDVKELIFVETEQRLLFDLRLGLFRDLEFHAQAPLVLGDESEIRFEDGVSGVSTIFGSPNADDPTFDGRYPLTAVPAARRRTGFGDMTFGLSWSPLVDRKDPTFPTLTLRGDVTTPTGELRDPKDQRALTSVSGNGDVGRGVLAFDVSVAVSKRMGMSAPYFDPYVILGGRFPVVVGEQRRTGLEPPASGRFRVGTAIVLGEQPKERLYSIDVAFGLRYVASGRTYSELSDYLPDFDQTRVPDRPAYSDYADPQNYAVQAVGTTCGILDGIPCGELNQVDEHLVLSGTLAVLLQPNRWLRFRIGVDASLTTDHVLTGEKVGTDTDPASAGDAMCGATPCLGRINTANSLGQDERSPYYDPRYDEVGRRLIAAQILDLRIFVTTFITF